MIRGIAAPAPIDLPTAAAAGSASSRRDRQLEEMTR
jgi:hypothetical protein